ncbi:MarR family winged helix-turn-helix transcriptional regulator [Faecalicatena faecalis]|nr:MarR family transcriptional regulator [Faecalicatena faecalis]
MDVREVQRKGALRMNCDMGQIPTVGIMGQIMHLSMKKATQLFEKFNLKPGQAGILFMLDHAGELSQREMAKHLNVTPPSITAAIQKMEKEGYIRRRPDEKDQRIMRLSITEKGEACLKDIKDVAMKMDAGMFKGMSQEEKLLLRRLLLQMRDNLSEMPVT